MNADQLGVLLLAVILAAFVLWALRPLRGWDD